MRGPRDAYRAGGARSTPPFNDTGFVRILAAGNNKGKLVGQKAPLKPKDIWAIRIHLQNAHAVRDLAMFNLAIDSKLRGCDLVSLRVRDVTHGNQVLSRAMVVQRKTQRPVQFELTEPTRAAVAAWIAKAALRSEDFLFQSRLHNSPHLSPSVREDR